MSPWAAQTPLWLNSAGKRVQSRRLPSSPRAGRGRERGAKAPALLPSILGLRRRSRRRERAAVPAAGGEGRGQVMLLPCPGKNSSRWQAEARSLQAAPWGGCATATAPKRTVRAMLEEKTLIPAWFFWWGLFFWVFFFFNSGFECAAVVLWEWFSRSARPVSIHRGSRCAASSPRQLVVPRSSCSAAACRSVAAGQRPREERGSAPSGWERLWGQGTARREEESCWFSPPALPRFYLQVTQAGGVQWDKSRLRNIKSFARVWVVGVCWFWGFLVGFLLNSGLP